MNSRGETSYGGSDLVIVRGGYEELLTLDLPMNVRRAIQQAIVYDRVVRSYPHLIVSRQNYDVGQGWDSQGIFRSGVFEQSWRVGGGSGAEVAALHAFRNDPTIQVVEASSVVRYGENIETLPGALVHFDGIDPDYGAMTLYTVVTSCLRHTQLKRPA